MHSLNPRLVLITVGYISLFSILLWMKYSEPDLFYAFLPALFIVVEAFIVISLSYSSRQIERDVHIGLGVVIPVILAKNAGVVLEDVSERERKSDNEKEKKPKMKGGYQSLSLEEDVEEEVEEKREKEGEDSEREVRVSRIPPSVSLSLSVLHAAGSDIIASDKLSSSSPEAWEESADRRLSAYISCVKRRLLSHGSIPPPPLSLPSRMWRWLKSVFGFHVPEILPIPCYQYPSVVIPPQRLLIALTSSFTLVSLLCLCFSVGLQWLYFLVYTSTTNEATQEGSLASGIPPLLVSSFTLPLPDLNASGLLFRLLGFAGARAEEHTKVAKYVTTIYTVITVTCVLSVFAVGYVCISIYFNYVKNIRLLRKGKCYFVRSAYEKTAATGYIGYQISHLVFSYVFTVVAIGLMGLAILFAFMIRPIREYVFHSIGGWIAYAASVFLLVFAIRLFILYTYEDITIKVIR